MVTVELTQLTRCPQVVVIDTITRKGIVLNQAGHVQHAQDLSQGMLLLHIRYCSRHSCRRNRSVLATTQAQAGVEVKNRGRRKFKKSIQARKQRRGMA